METLIVFALVAVLSLSIFLDDGKKATQWIKNIHLSQRH